MKKANKNESKLKAKPASNSRVQMTEIVLPSHTNQIGTIFGGQIMAWIDIAGAIAATKHARSICVTASIDTLYFVAPARLGDSVYIYASVNYTHRTSMETGVRVESENPRTGVRKHIATAYLTFVALDEDGKPKEIPALLLKTKEEKRRFKDASLRRKSRLKLKSQIEKSH